MASSTLLRMVPCNGCNGVVSANRTSNSHKPWVGSRIRFTTTRKWEAAGGSSIRAGSSTCGTAVSDKSRTSPWLMLPPSFEETTAGENMKYNFYSLAEDKLISVVKAPPPPSEEEEGAESPDDDAVIVGSSHGWLVMYNHWSTAAMFLSNPLTRRHIKLPIAAPHLCRLSFPDLYVTSLLVSKVVISSSPDADDGCRAMMTYTPEKRLAFCCPGRSETESWTPIGEPFHTFDTLRYARQYEDVVYSARHKLFFCATTYGDFESWDLSDPESPAMTPVVLSPDPDNYPWSDRAWETIQALGKMCSSHKFLVVDEKTGQLYHVRQFVRDRVYSNKLLLHYDSDVEYDGTDPYMTVGFDVHRVDVEKGELVYMDGSLGGLAMFVGLNHSFALCAGEFPGVKPDSIYFTDVFSPPYWDGGAYGGHDIGIYDYVDGTISPCYYPVGLESIQRIVPSPMWFTPNFTSFN